MSPVDIANVIKNMGNMPENPLEILQKFLLIKALKASVFKRQKKFPFSTVKVMLCQSSITLTGFHEVLIFVCKDDVRQRWFCIFHAARLKKYFVCRFLLGGFRVG